MTTPTRTIVTQRCVHMTKASPQRPDPSVPGRADGWSDGCDVLPELHRPLGFHLPTFFDSNALKDKDVPPDPSDPFRTLPSGLLASPRPGEGTELLAGGGHRGAKNGPGVAGRSLVTLGQPPPGAKPRCSGSL